MIPSFNSSSFPSANFLQLSTIPNVHRNTTMAPRKGRFSCGHESSALPTGQTAYYHLLGHAYYTHCCKACMKGENRGRQIAMRSHYYFERVRLHRAICRGKSLLAENQFNTTTNREAHKTELKKKEEEQRKLNPGEIMAFKAIWSTYHGLWPMVQQLPTRTPHGG